MWNVRNSVDWKQLELLKLTLASAQVFAPPMSHHKVGLSCVLVANSFSAAACTDLKKVNSYWLTMNRKYSFINA